jgi:DNA-binding FadR family transcriptional regulator
LVHQSDAELHPPLLDRIERWLQATALPADGRLPPERRLAATFGVSRAELRKALAVLEAEGRLSRTVGRGTFLTPGSSAPPMVEAIADRTSPPDAMQARFLIEPELAGLAALSANAAQLSEMRALADRMRSAESWDEYRLLDARFHDIIAEATGNPLLVATYRVINGVRRSVAVKRLRHARGGPAPDHHSFDEHDRILEAIEHHNRSSAAAAMRTHLQATATVLMA